MIPIFSIRTVIDCLRPRNSNEAKELSAQQLDWLLQGLNPLPIRKIQAVRPGSFY